MKKLLAVTVLTIIGWASPAVAWEVTVDIDPVCVEDAQFVDVTFHNPEDEIATIDIKTPPHLPDFTIPAGGSVTQRFEPHELTFKPSWPSDDKQPAETYMLRGEDCGDEHLPTTTTIPATTTTTSPPVVTITPIPHPTTTSAGFSTTTEAAKQEPRVLATQTERDDLQLAKTGPDGLGLIVVVGLILIVAAVLIRRRPW